MPDSVRGGSNDASLPLISTEEVTIVNGTTVPAQQVQRIIPAVRTADGTATDVSAADPLPVVQTGTPVLPTGAATQTTLAAILAALGAPLQAGGTVGLDAAALAALETITVGLDAASLAALESITAAGPLTDAQLRAAAVPVSAAALPLPAGAATEATLAARLTDLAELITDLAALLPASIGQKGAAESTSVVIASDQPAFFVAPRGLSGGLVHGVVAVGVTAVLIPAEPDPLRIGINIANTGTTTIYIGNADIVASGVASGGAPPLPPGWQRYYAIAADVALYGRGDGAGGFCAYQEILDET